MTYATTYPRRLCILLAGIAGWFAMAFAQPRVSLLTVEPGRDIYELDGHTALRFVHGDSVDYSVNWGVFDFNSPNFLYRFVKGETDYMAYPFPTGYLLQEYAAASRGVTEQVILLDSLQAVKLEEMVMRNLEPQNRTYRYNYIYDNCATRPLLLIEKALGDTLRLAPGAGYRYPETGITDSGAPTTFRREMTRQHSRYPWYQFGIDLALGSGLDRPISERERLYSPLFLRHAIAADPRVGPSTTLLACPDAMEPATPWYLTPLAVSSLFLLVTAAVAWRDIRRKRITRWYDSAVYGLFTLAGLLLTFLIFVSVHEATSPNWLYLWLNPLCIIPVVGEWIKKGKRVVKSYQICNFAALTLLIIIALCGVQVLNGAFYILIAADMLLSIRYLIVNR